MILSAPILTVIKYSFLGLVVTGAGFLIANTALTLRYKSEKMEHLPYRGQFFPRNVSLDRNSLFCLTHPRKPFCLMPAKKREKLLKSISSGEVRESGVVRPFYWFIKDFVDLANHFKVAPILLEPSILFCMLSTLQKYLLFTNNLQTKILHGPPHHVTFGILERESRILTKETSVNRSATLGFEFSRSRGQLYQNGEFVDTSFSFSRLNLTVTVIVFFERETFYWHPGLLENKSSAFLPLQFARSQAYENFTAVPFILEDGRQSGLHLPSEVTHFLLQVQNSEFEECWPLSVSEGLSHPTLSREQLFKRALITIQEMKLVLRPLLGTFWLWNDTLSGWNDNCDIFQKTLDFHIAVALPVSADWKMDLNSMFMNNEYLRPVEYHKWDDFQLHLTLDCYGLRIHITVIYADHETMWNYERDRTGNLIKNNYPNLQLCSTSVLGQLVHKPCSNQAAL